MVHRILRREDVESLFDRARFLSVGVIGDFCVDVYWEVDMTRAELIREVPLYNMPVTRERFSPGAASNVVWNLSDMGVGRIECFGVLGDDWRGDVLEGLLGGMEGVDTTGLVRVKGRFTHAFCKPLLRALGNRQYAARIDFENEERPGEDAVARVLDLLERRLDALDVVLLCDQVASGCLTPRAVEALSAMAARGNTVFVADSRYRVGDFDGMVLKPNEFELMEALGGKSSAEGPDEDVLRAAASRLAESKGIAVFVTAGDRGIFLAEPDRGVTHVPAVVVSPPVDVTGAGDTVMASLAVALGGGVSMIEAAAFSVLCAAVTVSKLDCTGTAPRHEVLEMYERRYQGE